jgi:hypothetical protein
MLLGVFDGFTTQDTSREPLKAAAFLLPSQAAVQENRRLFCIS